MPLNKKKSYVKAPAKAKANFHGNEKHAPPINKYKELLQAPLQVLVRSKKDLTSYLQIARTASLVKSPINIRAEKFNDFVGKINTSYNRSFALALPIILFRMSTLFLKHKDIFIRVLRSLDTTKETDEWSNLSFISKLLRVSKDYLNIISKTSIVFGIAEIIVLLSIVLDDLPRILVNKDYLNLEDLALPQLFRQLAQNTSQIEKVIVDVPANDKKIKLAKEDAKNLTDKITELNDTLIQAIQLPPQVYSKKIDLNSGMAKNTKFRATAIASNNFIAASVPIPKSNIGYKMLHKNTTYGKSEVSSRNPKPSSIPKPKSRSI